MASAGDNLELDDVAQYRASREDLRRVADECLPAESNERNAFVADVLPDDHRELRMVCQEYFTYTLPDGSEAYDRVVDMIQELAVGTDIFVSGVLTVQSTVFLEAERTGNDSVSVIQLAGFARIVGYDGAQIATRVTRGEQAESPITPEATLETTSPDEDGDQEDLVESIQERAVAIESSTFEIETLADQQADNTDKLTAEIDDISSAIEEIAVTSAQVNQQSDEAQTRAVDGRERANEIAQRLDRINDNAVDVRERVEALRTRTQEIDEIVEVINGIADQTNMLALNASIEAARAGEGSEGFAVVADEVKSLAEDSKDRVTEIEELVNGIQSGTEQAAVELDELEAETDEGLAVSSEALETFDEIESIVTTVSKSLEEVNNATEQQAESADMLSMMIAEADRKASNISEEISEIVEANERQLADLETFDQNGE